MLLYKYGFLLNKMKYFLIRFCFMIIIYYLCRVLSLLWDFNTKGEFYYE